MLPVAHNFTMSSPGSLGLFHAGGTVVLCPQPSPDVAFGTLSEPQRMYIDTSKVTGTPAPFSNKVIGDTGLNAPYAATMPQMALNYIICTKGLYPEFP